MVKQRISMSGVGSHDYASKDNSDIGWGLPFNESFQSIHCFDHGPLYLQPPGQVPCVGLEGSQGQSPPGLNAFLFEPG